MNLQVTAILALTVWVIYSTGYHAAQAHRALASWLTVALIGIFVVLLRAGVTYVVTEIRREDRRRERQ
jgi:hypothetical protein